MGSGRVPTYVENFDDKLGGGVPEGHLVLFCGEPGTMKSSLAYYMMYHNAKRNGRSGVYVTLEQSRASLITQMRGMGFDPTEVEDKVTIVDLGTIRKNLEKFRGQSWTEIFKMYAQNLKKNVGFDLLAVDSLPVLSILAKFRNPREDLFDLFEWLRELDVTSFIISEMTAGSDNYGKYGEDFVADGIIHVKMERLDDVNVQRRIRCVKMRGTSHSPNYFTLLFQDGTFQAARVLAE